MCTADGLLRGEGPRQVPREAPPRLLLEFREVGDMGRLTGSSEILCWNPRLRCFYTTPPPSIPPEQLASGCRQVSRQSSSPVDPELPAPELPASGSRPVSCQYRQSTARARQCIPPSIPPDQPASGSRQVSHQTSPPVDPAKQPASGSRQVSLALGCE